MKCYSAVEDKLGSVFERLGHFIARNPWKIIILVIAVNGLLGIGMLNLKTDIDVSRVYTPMNSQAIKDESVVKDIFPDKSGTDFYNHQLVISGKSATVILKPNSGNILDNAFLDESARLDSEVRNVTTDKDLITFNDICARRSNSCVVSGDLFLTNAFRIAVSNHNVSFPNFRFASGLVTSYSSLLSGISVQNGTLKSAAYMKMQYFIRTDTSYFLQSAKVWEQKLVEVLQRFSSDKFDFAFSHTDSLSEELNANIGGDISLFSVTFTLMIIYACVATYSAKHDCIGNRMLLGFAGVLAAGLSIIAAFGLVSACGMSFVSIVGNVPFLLIGIGVDNMFILLSGMADATYDGNTVSRIGQMMRKSGVAITITSLTDILAFGAGASSTFKSVRNFCVYTGVAICFCYINQTFLFSACVAINENRVNSKRHFICCHRTKSKTEMKQEGVSKSRIFCCSGIPPKSRKDVEGFQEKGVRKYLSKFVLFTPVKCIVLVLFACYLGVSIWGATNLQQGLVVKDLVAEDSYFYKYQTWEDDVFPYSVPVSLVIDEQYQYSNSETQRNIENLETNALDNKLISSTSPVSWLNTYRSAQSFYRNSSEVEFIKGLRLFLQQPQYESFQNDVVIRGQSIIASRFYVFTSFIDNTQDRGKMMQNIREIANTSPLSVIAYSPTFVFYEQYIAILPQTLQTLGAGLAAVFLITIIFMPHPTLLLFVVFTMGMIMTGIIGFLYFWKLTLSSVTMIHLIMCVGFSVDFTAHICHAYMIANESSRNKRVSVALTSSGGPIFNGAVSSVLGILMLSIAKSYIFRSFFEVMLLVIIFGASHALFFLPVVLSLFGPGKATSRNRSKNTGSVDHIGYINNGMDLSNGYAKKRTESQEKIHNCRISSPPHSEIQPKSFEIPRPRISRSPVE